MGAFLKLVGFITLLGAVFFGKKCLFGCNHNVYDAEPIRQDAYFGAKPWKVGQPIPTDSVDVKPFKVAYPEEDLQDLKHRLERAKFIENNVEDAKFNYGFPSKYLKEIVQYWRNKYDWRREEAKLNAFPQFMTTIEGLGIHFIHAKADKSAKKIVPLLAVHGWPGSVLEYYKSLPLLTTPDADGLAYDVILPSIPGYGYSEAPHKQGFDCRATARVFVKLMKRLGYDKFFVHGGDWGAMVSRLVAVGFPQNVLGTHTTMNMNPSPTTPGRMLRTLLAAFVPNLYFGENADKEYSKSFPMSDKFFDMLAQSGYMHIQATKPDTVATALRDSPVGLAAYILEKFAIWTDPANVDLEDGGLTKKFTLDELLTNIMIYWTSGNIASSQRYYKENIKQFMDFQKMVVPGPAGSVDAPHELARAPRKLVECTYENLIHYSESPKGGHFLAFEEPKFVCDDIRLFTKRVFQFYADQAKNAEQKQEM